MKNKTVKVIKSSTRDLKMHSFKYAATVQLLRNLYCKKFRRATIWAQKRSFLKIEKRDKLKIFWQSYIVTRRSEQKT